MTKVLAMYLQFNDDTYHMLSGRDSGTRACAITPVVSGQARLDSKVDLGLYVSATHPFFLGATANMPLRTCGAFEFVAAVITHSLQLCPQESWN